MIPVDMTELVELVDQWAREKGIYEKGTPEGQLKKMQEEVMELALELGASEFISPFTSEKNMKLELGDVFVTAIAMAGVLGFTPEECLGLAYDKISSRKGEMKDGQFVKSEESKLN